MNTDGGGWTLVVAAFEDDILYNWNEGIQSDYQPDLTTRKSFALNSSELPTHSQISYSAVNSSDLKIGSEAFNFIYSTGNIQTQTIQSYTTLKNLIINKHESKGEKALARFVIDLKSIIFKTIKKAV